MTQKILPWQNISARKGKLLLVLITIFSLFITLLAQAQDRNEDHEALRTLLKQSVAALDSGNIEALRSATIPDVLITTAEQHRTGTFDDFKKYYDGLFNGPNAKLSTISFQPVADELTKFIDNNVGIVSGTSTDTYKFKDGDVRTMTSRWTSTLVKDGGQWKIASFHFGVNFMENPVLDAIKAFTTKAVVLCGLVGLLLGALLIKMFSRREVAALR